MKAEVGKELDPSALASVAGGRYNAGKCWSDELLGAAMFGTAGFIMGEGIPGGLIGIGLGVYVGSHSRYCSDDDG
ncbi:MAG TPA: hypothetical protein VKF40_12005 [Burkholderiales bacterium]|nr:hypothetical protein [Burkholderiales bacterium]